MTDLLKEVLEGYAALPRTTNPYLYSSPAYLGFRAGQALVGFSIPKKARMSRGYSVRVETGGGNIITVKFSGESLRIVDIVR